MSDRVDEAAKVIEEHWEGDRGMVPWLTAAHALDKAGLLSEPLPDPDENGLWKTGVASHDDVAVTPHGEVHLGSTNVTQRHLFLSEDKAYRLAMVILAAVKKIKEERDER